MSGKNMDELDESRPSTEAGNSVITINLTIPYIMLAAGALSLAVSFAITSYFLLFIGLALIFWGGILNYVAPSRQVPLELLVATATPLLSEIHRTLSDLNLTSKGIYLPPKYLEDPESVLIYVPFDPEAPLPRYLEKKTSDRDLELKKGLLLTPPGFSLSKFFERRLKTSFTRMNLKTLKEKLPKSLIESWEIVEDAKMSLDRDSVIFESRKDILDELHKEAVRLNINETVGYALSSAIACAIAKASGRPIIIEREEYDSEKETTKTVYRMLEE